MPRINAATLNALKRNGEALSSLYQPRTSPPMSKVVNKQRISEREDYLGTLTERKMEYMRLSRTSLLRTLIKDVVNNDILHKAGGG